MASLLVELHAVVDRYIRKSSNKELSGDIGSNVLEAARNVVKTRMFEPKNALRYRSVKPMNILAREIRRINAMLVRRMKPTPICRSLWNVVFSRYMPKEVFDLLDEYIQALNSQNSRSETKCTRQISITDEEKVMELFMQLVSMSEDENENTLNKSQILKTTILLEGLRCKLIVTKDKPFLLTYSNKRELLKINVRYGCWNINGIPQHI
jgi:hypothetical protein